MKVKIEIDTKTFVRFWLVVIGLGLAGFALYSARTALLIIGSALFLALALETPVNALAKRLPKRSRLLSTTIAFVSVVAILVGFVVLVVPPIVQQSMHLFEQIPSMISSDSQQAKYVSQIIDQYHLQDQVDRAVETAKSNAAGWISNISANVLSGISSLLSFVFATFLVLVLSFLMLLEGPRWLDALWGSYLDKQRMERHKELAGKMYAVLRGYVSGQLLVSLIGGMCAGITVFIMSFIWPLPASLAFPTVAIVFTLSLVPMFGATLAGIVIAIVLALNSIAAAIVFSIYFIIYQQVENNFISPQIQSRTIKLSALAVLIAVTIGTYVFGLLGGIISIPIAGSVKVLLEDWLQHRKAKHVAKTNKPLAKFIKKVARSNDAPAQ